MSEGAPTHSEKEPTKQEQILSLAKELFESAEIFPFLGINSESYAKMKADEEEYSGYTTSIDDLLERFKNEGIKIVLGKNPQSGNVFVLPSQSTNVEMDSISPKQLQINEGMNERLMRLILLLRS